MSDHPITPSPTRPVRPLLRAVALAWLLGADLLAQAEVFRTPDSGDDIIGEIRHARAHQEDTLIDIARRYSIGQDEMVMANPSVDRWLPKAGTDVVIPKEYILPDAPRAGIVVNIPEMRLYYFPVRASAPRKVPVAAKAPVVNTCKKPADKPANPEKTGAKTTAAKPGAKAATKSTAAANGKTANQSTVAAKAKPAARSASAANPKAAAKPCVASAAPRPPTPAPAPDATAFESSGAGEVITYPVSMGRMDWRTPIGKTTVVHKQKDPSWTPPASIKREHAAKGDPLPDVVPPGPDNPLGQFAMRLSVPGYLIHGTDAAKADGIGMRVTHGCMRLYNEDIAKLFPLVPVGAPVYLVNQPVKLGWRGGLLYMEVSQPLDEDVGIRGHDPDEDVSKEQLQREDELRARFLLRIARTEIQKMQDRTGASVDMDKVRRAVEKPTGIPLVIGGSGGDWRQAAASDEGLAPVRQEADPNRSALDARLPAPGSVPPRRPAGEVEPYAGGRVAPLRPSTVRGESAVGEARDSETFYSPADPYRPGREPEPLAETRPTDARTSPYGSLDPLDAPDNAEAEEE